jgi:hypothetical protein
LVKLIEFWTDFKVSKEVNTDDCITEENNENEKPNVGSLGENGDQGVDHFFDKINFV